jgi:V-type ATPase, subunit E, putative
MDSQIQALTEKVYQEGVLKGEQEAAKILADANAQAEQVERDARARAEQIIAEAQRSASELKSNTERELKLNASKLIEATKASIVDVLAGRIAGDSVQALTANPELLQRVVLEIAKGFDLKHGVEITSSQAEELKAYFAQNAKALLEEGLTIKQVAGKATQYTIRPQNGSFKVEIGEQEFVELFKSILRPQLAQELF